MSAKIYLKFLIFCGIFCQGIIGSFLEEKESSNLLVRKKRVLNYGPNGNSLTEFEDYGYIVSIRENRKKHHCLGAILSFRFVITAAKCVVLPVTEYKINPSHSGFVDTDNIHNITTKNIQLSNEVHRPTDGITLVTVNPTFQFSEQIHSIGFHGIPVQPGTLATVAGWGCTVNEHQRRRKLSTPLESITVPIIDQYTCANAYRQFFPITAKDICTHDITWQQFCGVTDQGAPLVVRGRGGRIELIGINLWGGSLANANRPDIYVNLYHPRYRNWIGGYV